MDAAVQAITYRCGHEEFLEWSAMTSREDLYRAAEIFPCPGCCRLSANESQLDTQVFVNMQQLSEGMSALVVEVTQVCVLLEELLALMGYVRREGSLDELHPGGAPRDEQHAVWRKEFWFAAATSPFQVIALLDLVKDEARWLSNYLPEPNAVHYLGFPVLD
ncbi:MAG: hypothetical protein P4L87_14665 [Formivibrio sp.]|nr:hypothetical protein [Formivibrio sp.]